MTDLVFRVFKVGTLSCVKIFDTGDYGCYPVSVYVDKINRTRDNIRYCKERGIQIAKLALGRRKKNHQEDDRERKNQKARIKQDERDRIPIEGKFGQGKRRFRKLKSDRYGKIIIYK